MKNNSTLILLIGSALALAGPVSCGHAASEQKASYGTQVKYRPGQKIEFPDFTVEYIGERRKDTPAYPRGFLYYDFRVRTANVEKVVSWSSGTGDIGPVEFEIAAGKRFLLELRRSDKLGKLNENELVIWKSGAASQSWLFDARPHSLAAIPIRMSEVYPRHSVVTVDEDFRAYRRNKREVIPWILPPGG